MNKRLQNPHFTILLLGRRDSFADGVNWKTWMGYYYSVKRVEVKIRPVKD